MSTTPSYYTYYQNANSADWSKIPIYADAVNIIASVNTADDHSLTQISIDGGGTYTPFSIKSVKRSMQLSLHNSSQYSSIVDLETTIINTSCPYDRTAGTVDELWSQAWKHFSSSSEIQYDSWIRIWHDSGDKKANLDINGSFWAGNGIYGDFKGHTYGALYSNGSAINIGSQNTPVYFSNGWPVQITRPIPEITFDNSTHTLTIKNY